MSRFLVIFDQPVNYQPSHPRRKLGITELMVNADSAEAAKIHAIRVVEGAFSTISVHPLVRPSSLPATEGA